MLCDKPVIRVQGLSKCFHIYDNPRDRIKQLILPILLKLAGKPIKKYFKNFWALESLSFDILKGETVGILGRNGSGKSTLLQIICGTLTPTRGSVDIQGKVAALLELGSGFNPEFTGRENIYMNATVYGLSTKEIDERFDDIVNFADIDEFINQPIKSYSSGMVVRLAFSVIAHVDADILVIDEALAVGDAFFAQKCMRFLRKFMETGTVLFVSHDTAAVANLCSKVILLKDGRIAEIGSPKNVIDHYLTTLYELEQRTDGVNPKPLHEKQNEVEHQNNIRSTNKITVEATNQAKDVGAYEFDSNQKGFGTGDATITSVRLFTHDGIPISSVIGNEYVSLEINCMAHKDIFNPIAGFQFKDRLGQIIFGDNSLIAYQLNPINFKKNSSLNAKFEFQMPLLPLGTYSITAAIADESKDGLVQHHWIHDALIIKVNSSAVRDGLVGVEMKSINLLIE